MSVESPIELIEAPSMPLHARPRTRVRRGLVVTLMRDAAIVVLLVLGSELALQLLAPAYGHDYYDHTLTASYPVTFNAEGYRGPAVPLEKKPGEKRIIAMGDSTTFGTGVSFEQTWPIQLRDKLDADKSGNDHTTVMNVALQGASLADMAFGLDQKWSAYKPDVATVMISSNMIALAYIHRQAAPQMPPYVMHGVAPSSTKDKIAREAGRLCLPHFLSLNSQRAMYWLGVMDHQIAVPTAPFGAMIAHGWRQGNLPVTEADDAWAAFAAELRYMKDVCDRHHLPLVIGFSPCRFDVSDSFFDNEKNVPMDRITIQPATRLSAVCAAEHVECVDTLDAIRQDRQTLTAQRGGHTASMYILFDYNHLNVDGHGAVASALLPFVQADLTSK